MVGKRKDWSEEVLSSNLSCWLSRVWKDSWKEKGISRRDSTSMLHACSVVSDSVTQWTVADPSGSSVRRIFQARIWSGLPFLPPEALAHPRIKPTALVSPALAGRLLNTEPPGKPIKLCGAMECKSIWRDGWTAGRAGCLENRAWRGSGGRRWGCAWC